MTIWEGALLPPYMPLRGDGPDHCGQYDGSEKDQKDASECEVPLDALLVFDELIWELGVLGIRDRGWPGSMWLFSLLLFYESGSRE